MQGRDIVESFLSDHGLLREKLREWTAAQNQAADGPYGQCRHAVTVMRGLCRFVEHEISHHFREEEAILYTAVRQRLPQHSTLVGELQGEHDLIRKLFEEFRQQLAVFNAKGQLGELPRLSRELIAYLRYHMDREEQLLHPLITQEFKEDDWVELRRLYVHSEVA